MNLGRFFSIHPFIYLLTYFCGTGDGIQGPAHAGQVPRCIPNAFYFLFWGRVWLNFPGLNLEASWEARVIGMATTPGWILEVEE